MLAVAVHGPTGPAPSDEQLMLAAGRGDREAFAAIVDRHQRRVLNLLLFLCGDRETARDLTQECFLRLLRAAPRWEPRARLTTYVTTIARRLAMDAGAKAWERREPLETEPASADPGPDVVAERRELAGRLAAVLAQLPDEDREVLVLSEAGGLKYREIAEMLAVPEGTVASRKSRAVRRVRELWRAAAGKEETL
jgi:RNA polymerase sigma-70 factor (ECF subfamily)